MKTWVFFCPAIGVPLWSRFCDPKFTHCFMIKEQETYGVNLYIRLEGLTRSIVYDVSLLPIEDTIEYLRGKLDHLKILQGEYDGGQPDSFNQLCHLNCVSIVKKALGIDKPLILTPKQLYRHLKAKGYKEV